MSMGDGGMGDTGPGGIADPQKPKRSGFRTLLYVLVGIGGLLVLTCGGLILYASQNPAIRETISAAMEAQSAEGTEELRAAGCSQAAVMDIGAAMDALIEEAGEGAPGEIGIPKLFVTCQRSSDAAIDCDEVARVYLGSVGAREERFVAQVNGGGLSADLLCQVVYEGDGTRIGSLEEVAREAGEDGGP